MNTVSVGTQSLRARSKRRPLAASRNFVTFRPSATALRVGSPTRLPSMVTCGSTGGSCSSGDWRQHCRDDPHDRVQRRAVVDAPPPVGRRGCASLPAMNDFEGRAALVTGATRGIGFGIAAEIVARGGSVCVTARKPDELDAAVKELDPDGTGRAIAARGSADDEEHQQAAVDLTMERFG